MAIENPMVSPLNSGNPPKKYCVKSQFGVTKNLIQVSLNCCASTLIISELIEPRSVMAIAKAEFEKIVLNAKAKVNSKMYIGNFPIACNAKYGILPISSS